MPPVNVITFRLVKDPRLVQVAVTAFVKDWVKRRNDAGESTPEIAKSLGFKSHASVVQYLTPGHPVKVTDAVQRRVAELAFGGSRDRLDEEALHWFEQNSGPPDLELPTEYHRALGRLEALHDRDFTEAARAHFLGASHKGDQITGPLLADQIYELAQQMKGKAEFQRSDGVELTEADATAPGIGGKRGRKK